MAGAGHLGADESHLARPGTPTGGEIDSTRIHCSTHTHNRSKRLKKGGSLWLRWGQTGQGAQAANPRR